MEWKWVGLTLISHIYQNVEQNLRGNLCDEGNTTLLSLNIIITLACAYLNCEGKPPLSHAISLRDTGRHQQELIRQKRSDSQLDDLSKIPFVL